MKPLVLVAACATIALFPSNVAGDPANAADDLVEIVDGIVKVGGTVSVPCTGGTVSGGPSTVSGLTYTISVSGTCLYGDGAGIFDCYGFSPGGQTGTWYANQQFHVNGVNASPSCQPYNPAHTYSFSRPGTGSQFTFNTYDHGGAGDNTGSLTVRVSLKLL